MQGHPEVIDYLNTLLTGELAARDQYFIHSRMYEDWGFSKLYERLNHEMEEETQHADALLRRILLLEGTPRMRPDDIHPGTTVPEMLGPTSSSSAMSAPRWPRASPSASSTRTSSAATSSRPSWPTPRKTTPTGWSNSLA